MACDQFKTFLGIFMSFFTIVVNLTSFITLCFVYHCYMPGLLALLCAILACIIFHLRRIHACNVLGDWYSTEHLEGMRTFSFASILIGVAFIVWNVFAQFYYNIPLDPLRNSAVISIIWSMVLTLLGIILLVSIKRYSVITDEMQRLLPSSSYRR